MKNLETDSTGHASIIIPVYNQVHFTEGCLDSLEADSDRPPLEIIVIDNHSTDETKEYLASEKRRLCDPQDILLKVITNETNLGVAPAWNQGLTAATGNVLAVLNNDIQVTKGWLKACTWALKEHDLALVSPFAATGELDYPLEQRGKIFTQKNQERLWPDFDFCAVVLPRKTWETIGPFDEKFLVGGYEDTDYAYRLKKAGLRYGVTGAAFIHHFGSQTLGEFKRRGDKHAAHNKEYFISKWGEDPSYRVGTLPWRLKRIWRRTKMRFDLM